MLAKPWPTPGRAGPGGPGVLPEGLSLVWFGAGQAINSTGDKQLILSNKPGVESCSINRMGKVLSDTFFALLVSHTTHLGWKQAR